MYSFLRIKKFKRGDVFPVLREAQRTPALHYEKGVNFDNNIDWTKTANNFQLVNSSVGGVGEVMRRQGVKPRNKDSVVLVGAVVGASSEYFNRDDNGNWIYDEKAQAFGEDVKKLVVEQLCGGDASRLVSLVAHLDEDSIHWHAFVVPIVETPEGERKLSAKALLNGRQRMRQLQDRAFEILGKPRGLERGELVDLDQPAKSQKRHKTTGQHRDERAQAALDKIIEAGEHLDKEDVELLNDLKDAAFGRGKILPIEKYNKAVEIIKTLEALPTALEALKDLRTQADHDGRIKTLESRVKRGNAICRDFNNELKQLRPKEQEAQAFGQLLQRLRVSPERSFLDMWEQSKRLRTNGNGEIDYNAVVDCFIDLYRQSKQPKQQRQQVQAFEMYSHDDHDGQEWPTLGGDG